MKRVAPPANTKEQSSCKKSKKSDLFASPASAAFTFGFGSETMEPERGIQSQTVPVLPSSFTINDPTVMIEHEDAFTGVRSFFFQHSPSLCSVPHSTHKETAMSNVPIKHWRQTVVSNSFYALYS